MSSSKPLSKRGPGGRFLIDEVAMSIQRLEFLLYKLRIDINGVPFAPYHFIARHDKYGFYK